MAFMEVKGSRQEARAGKMRVAVILGVSDDLTDIPVAGDTYPEDVPTPPAEETLDRRVCEDVKITPEEPVPGMYWIAAQHKGVIPFTPLG